MQDHRCCLLPNRTSPKSNFEGGEGEAGKELRFSMGFESMGRKILLSEEIRLSSFKPTKSICHSFLERITLCLLSVPPRQAI